jgi:dolichol-phosphate mannosyltransferase
MKKKLITILIPCYNEEKGIGKVIKGIPKQKLKSLGYDVEVLVIDNNSKDKTSKIAKSLGARVIHEPNQGKGNALKTGFRNIAPNSDYIIMIDGDNTYKPDEIYRLIEPLETDFADVILGSRLEGKMKGKAMSSSHRIANWIFTFLVRRFYGANVTDVCTGYFAWKSDALKKLNGHIKSEGFAIETEMVTKMAKLGLKLYSVPITYEKRMGESKIAPIGDGIKIMRMIFKNMSWKP